METSVLYSVLFLLTVVVNIAIAALVYAHNPRHLTNKLFFLLCVSLAFWLVVMWSSSLAVQPEWICITARLSLLFATPLNVSFFLFSSSVPDDALGVSKKNLWLLLAAAAAVMVVSASPLAIASVRVEGGVSHTVTGIGMVLFGIFQTALNIGAIVTLLSKVGKATGARQKQLQLVLMGILFMVALITGSIFVPVLFLGNAYFVKFSPLYALIFTGLSGYAIFRQGLLDVKIVSAQIFSALLMLTSAIQIFQSASAFEFVIHGFMLFVVIAVSILFIQSVREEVRRREELQALAADLAAANNHLKEMDDVKNEFISIASHQLRTPISIIKGYLSLMQEGAYGAMPAQMHDKVNSMFFMNERLVQMVNNMLNISRIEKHRIEYDCGLTDVTKIARDTVAEHGTKAREKNITLRVDGADEVHAFIDATKVSEALSNLVDNAIKYSKAGEIVVRVTHLPKKKSVQVAVTDEGFGMDDETKRNIFQKFYRSKDPAVVREYGTGLGLYVVKMFVRDMGGDVWVEKTAPGKGTTFTMLLPAEEGGKCVRPGRRQSER